MEWIQKSGSHATVPRISERSLTLYFLHSSPQLEEQQTLEEAISVATAAMQQGAVTLETTGSESGC